MKYITVLIALITLISCSSSEQQPKSTIQSIKQKDKCDNFIQFGDIDICLPKIDGMKECYSYPIVKKLCNQFKGDGNSVLAFYLNDTTYSQVKKLDKITYDDYFTICSSNNLKSVKASRSEMYQVASALEGNFIKDNWAEFKHKIEKNKNFISIGRPVSIENYSLSPNIKTYVTIGKNIIKNHEHVIISVINVILIKYRIMWLAYYKDYDGEKSIKIAKAKNDYIILQLMDENQ